jgi:hypothetical protein
MKRGRISKVVFWISKKELLVTGKFLDQKKWTYMLAIRPGTVFRFFLISKKEFLVTGKFLDQKK